MRKKGRLYAVLTLFLLLLPAVSTNAAIDPAVVQKLLAEDSTGDFSFGGSISLDGDTAIIGEVTADSDGVSDAGAAYIFIRIEGAWIQQAKLVASDKSSSGRFGCSVSVDGDIAVVGASQADSDEMTDAGAVYVFTRSDGIWTQQVKLTADDKDVGDHFGESVSVEGDTVVIGSSGVDLDGLTQAGAAYVFTGSGSTWMQQAKLMADDKGAYDQFGKSVSLDGNTIVIGAWTADSDGLADAGAAYVFIRSDGIWTQQAKLIADDKKEYDYFGYSVVVDEDSVIVGAWTADPDGLNDAGAAYVFTRYDGIWTQQARLTADDKVAWDCFGFSVSIDGDTAIIGAFAGAHPVGDPEAGAAYVFTRLGTTWVQQVKLTADDKDAGYCLGIAVSVSADTAMVGAIGDNYSVGGTVYVFGSYSNNITVDAGGICTLPDAITAANTDTATGGCPAGSGHDEIILETDVLLAAALPEITSPITIEAQGHTIDGNNGDWSVLTVTEDGDLTLNEVTITGADSTLFGGGIDNNGTLAVNNSTLSGNRGYYGGGLSNYCDGVVTLSNTTISGNTAEYGGGVLNYCGSLTMSHCTVSMNSATWGGGIYSDGALTLTSLIISGNTADSQGGEVYDLGSTIADSTNVFGHGGTTKPAAFWGFIPGYNDVVATGDGTEPTALSDMLLPLTDNGGPTKTHALATGSPAIDLDATCSTGLSTDQRGYPRPVGGGCDAGAFEDNNSNITVDESTCTLADAITAANTDTATGGCSAGVPGMNTIILETDVLLAVALPEITSPITIEGQGHTINGNNNAAVGSVLKINAGNLILNEATVTGGHSTSFGGGIYTSGGGTLTMNSSTISGNHADLYGGGIYAFGGSVTLTSSTVSGNEAANSGGGIFTMQSTVVTLTDSTVSENHALGESLGGGGFFASGSVLTLTNSTVSGNHSTYYGGGILYYSGSTVTLNSSTVSGNEAAYSGGGISGLSSSVLTLNNSTVNENSTAELGGGIYAYNGAEVMLTNSTVSENEASHGGGIFSSYNAVVTLGSSTVNGNYAIDYGGGIVAYEAVATLTNSTVSGNFTAEIGLGGGIYTDNEATVTLTNSTVSENHAGRYGGGIYAFEYSDITLKSSLISGNKADEDKGVEIYNYNSTVNAGSFNLFGRSGNVLEFCFQENTEAFCNSKAFYNFTPSGNDVVATRDGTNPTKLSSILNSLADNGGPTMTHALVVGSPAINLDTACSAGLSVDQRGYPRPEMVGTGCDAGSFEGSVSPVFNGAFLPAIYLLLLNQ
ncbi:MAG: choice-of-anchor Q domain-containing protein [Candidatus Electrothrix scaldis]|nr:MAG: choice-of-anchor Q domain-containing protein [Candidatus Electrothrix sp. GW3-3]